MPSDMDGDDIYGGRSQKAVGARLALTRDVLGLKQGEFGERADIKPSMYNQIESGRSYPSVEAALRLCDTYRLTLDWIFRGEPSALEYGLADAIHKAHEARLRVVDGKKD